MSDEIVLLPKQVFGLRADVATNKQKYLRFPENTTPDIIVVSHNRKLLAVSEVNLASEETLINIYDLENLKTLKSLSVPAEVSVQTVSCMSFTGDSRGLALLTREPDAFHAIFSLQRSPHNLGDVDKSQETREEIVGEECKIHPQANAGEYEKDSDQMKSLMGMSSRSKKSVDAKMKIKSAITYKDEIEENYKKVVKDLENKLEILSVQRD